MYPEFIEWFEKVFNRKPITDDENDWRYFQCWHSGYMHGRREVIDEVAEFTTPPADDPIPLVADITPCPTCKFFPCKCAAQRDCIFCDCGQSMRRDEDIAVWCENQACPEFEVKKPVQKTKGGSRGT